MTHYKGVYIDGVFFNSKQDVDLWLKAKAIENFRNALNNFVVHHTMSESIHCDEIADRLHTVYGMSYGEIEAIEDSILA